MSTMASDTMAGQAPLPPVPPRPKRHRLRNTVAGVVILGAGIGIGTGIAGGSQGHPSVVYRDVPGPAVTQIVTQPPPPPPAGTVIGRWSGTGNQATPAFNAPDSGNYIVSWFYSGNATTTFGQTSGDNFIIEAVDSSAYASGLPNDIAASGSGSTEVTGASGTQSFNVQATGHWTIKVTTAP